MNALARVLAAALASTALSAGAVSAEPALFVVKDADTTVYMMGTVHLLKPGTVWDTPKIKAAMAEAKTTWIEIAEDESVAAPLVPKYGVDMTKPLSSKLTAAQKAKLAAALQKVGANPAQLEPLQPWLAAMTLTVLPLQKAGFDGKSGVDAQVKAQALAEGDALKGLETYDEQFRMFAEMSEAKQVEFLMQAADAVDQVAPKLEEAAALYVAGDMDALDRVMIADFRRDAPEAYATLMTGRNRAWAKKIAALLQEPGTHLVAVGAGHLAGPDSVQAQLETMGLTTKRR